MNLVDFLAISIGIGLVAQEAGKRRAEQLARELKRQSGGKPILSIGAKRNPFGDTRCDINPCADDVEPCDAHCLSQYADKQFSVAYLSHIIEHLDDPDKAMLEAQRVADNVIALTPPPYSLLAWICPDHKWIYWDGTNKMRIRQ